MLFAAALVAASSASTLAQSPGAATDAGAAVPGLDYRSAFSDYRRDEDVTRADWRQLNRSVDAAAGSQADHAGHGATSLTAADAPPPAVGQRHGGMHHGGMNHQGMNHPGMGHPGMGHPGMNHPGMNHPGMGHPGMRHPGHQAATDGGTK